MRGTKRRTLSFSVKVKLFRNKVPANAATIRKELEGIIQLIRFPTMSADEFSCGPATEEVLTAEVGTSFCRKAYVQQWTFRRRLSCSNGSYLALPRNSSRTRRGTASPATSASASSASKIIYAFIGAKWTATYLLPFCRGLRS